MPGHVPGIPVLTPGCKEMWVAGTSPAHDERANRFQAVIESLKMLAAVSVRI
jgi:hypothetical protein